jgi:predicted PurR-regulated permease PerM
MRFTILILILLFANFVCLGNKINPDIVKRVDSLIEKHAESRVILDSLRNEIGNFKGNLNEVRIHSEEFDKSVLEYGSSLAGILVGIIILFGVVYYNSSKQAAKDAFDDSFENYAAQINKKVKQANALLDLLESRVGFIEEGDNKFEDSSKNIENGYSTGKQN